MSSTARHRLSYTRRIRPRCGAPIAAHVALGSVLALLLESISMVRRDINFPRLERELHGLAHYVQQLKSFADSQVFKQFPLVTGFDSRVLSRVYYCGADPLTEAEILALVRFEAKCDALGISRGYGADQIAQHIRAGRLAPARLEIAPCNPHHWHPPADAAELLEHAGTNLARLSRLLRAAAVSDPEGGEPS